MEKVLKSVSVKRTGERGKRERDGERVRETEKGWRDGETEREQQGCELLGNMSLVHLPSTLDNVWPYIQI